ncbi:ribosomal protein S18 acetylase RimI-like enzyme [Litoreibacter ponti]|uniref:Ribosomal protein S18 acetylase RimI-like enzyme n=1 Tax=Litoreibacter ponti TaxID=1510457 RepID=A0A2T6BJZ0_9RHOB|nr:GNAT family N-acetyltransferase [Litoreibacter ponti]PTX56381.1 ribosomal protein S18 acetylase RimI-like enzyme [Litoreibacter ponti]
MSTTTAIRPATPKDFKAIADLHVRSWRKAYDGEFPGQGLPREVTEALHASWTAHEAKDSDVVLVVEKDRTVVGFAAVWCAPEPYLDNLHIIAEASGAGAGRALVSRLVAELVARGFNSLSLTVFESNHAARSFYAKLGGVEGAPFTVGIFGDQVRCFTVKWDDLSALA